MSWWARLWSRDRPTSETPTDAAGPASVASSELVEPRALDELRGTELGAPERGVAAFRSLLGGRHERAAIDAVITAHAERRAPAPLVVAAAELLVQRGEPDAALALLEGVRTNAALLLAAELFASRGEVARAVTLVERVLARDIEWPGARERHERYRRQLGGQVPLASVLDAPTLLRGEEPDTSLRIVAEAGRGGAGCVYEAVDDALGRRVALKVYHRPDRERDKLEREARLAVELAGRGIVRIFDADPGRGWITMEWLPGGALKGRLVRRDQEWLWPIESWLEPLARAVDWVHAGGLVHADLKPANVLFRAIAEPVVSDFGLAHPPGASVRGGSLGYLSPERLSGEPLALDDDVYALGRLVEDALDALSLPEEHLQKWRERCLVATAPRGQRPADIQAFRSLMGA